MSEWGGEVNACWQAINAHFRHVELDEFQIMPNHLHGILTIAQRYEEAPSARRGAACCAPTAKCDLSKCPSGLTSGDRPLLQNRGLCTR